MIDSDNWALQLDSVQILTLDTKKHQQSAPVAKPRLLFASLPWTTHCFLVKIIFVIHCINTLMYKYTTLWKYVDDTTLVESVSKNETSYMQLRVDELVRQSEADGFQLNESKCKELRISFSRSGSSVDHITINDKQIEVVSSAKLLGVVVSDNLRWNAHVESICKKAATRLYFLKQLKRAKVPPKDMLLFYTTCIRPVLEYACPVFHHSLPQYLSNEMERLQNRALRIIQPDLSYAEALVALDITSLYERRKALVMLYLTKL